MKGTSSMSDEDANKKASEIFDTKTSENDPVNLQNDSSSQKQLFRFTEISQAQALEDASARASRLQKKIEIIQIEREKIKAGFATNALEDQARDIREFGTKTLDEFSEKKLKILNSYVKITGAPESVKNLTQILVDAKEKKEFFEKLAEPGKKRTDLQRALDLPAHACRKKDSVQPHPAAVILNAIPSPVGSWTYACCLCSC